MPTLRQLFLANNAQTTGFPLLLEFERAEGIYMYDKEGRGFIDLISGIGVSNLGHSHPYVCLLYTSQVKSSSSRVSAVNKPAGTLFHYDSTNEFNSDKIKVLIPAGNLYDDVYFTFAALPKRPGAYSACLLYTSRCV